MNWPISGPLTSLVAQWVKSSPATQETWVWSLGWEGPLETGKATCSNTLAGRVLGGAESRTLALTNESVLRLFPILLWQSTPLFPAASRACACGQLTDTEVVRQRTSISAVLIKYRPSSLCRGTSPRFPQQHVHCLFPAPLPTCAVKLSDLCWPNRWKMVSHFTLHFACYECCRPVFHKLKAIRVSVNALCLFLTEGSFRLICKMVLRKPPLWDELWSSPWTTTWLYDCVLCHGQVSHSAKWPLFTLWLLVVHHRYKSSLLWDHNKCAPMYSWELFWSIFLCLTLWSFWN